MKKMTIALFTAAAMGASGFAVAQTGPDFSGRIDYTYTDAEGADGNGSATNSKLIVSGGDDGILDLSTFYHARLNLDSGSDSDNIDYAFTGVEGDFGRVSAGIDDDLVYKYVGVRSDVYRSNGPVFSAHSASGDNFGDNPGLQYHFNTGAFTFGAYGDTGATGDSDGVDHVQFGATADLGVISLGAVYADRRSIEGYDEELHLGATVDLGVASVRATIGNATGTPESGDDELDNPYHIVTIVPLTDVLTATLGYGNNDAADDANEVSDVTGMLMANLGGGVDVNVAARNGDTGDNVTAGIRYTF